MILRFEMILSVVFFKRKKILFYEKNLKLEKHILPNILIMFFVFLLHSELQGMI